LSLFFKKSLNSFLLLNWESFEDPKRTTLELFEEAVHLAWVIIKDLDIFFIIISVGSLNLVKQIEALLEFLIEHNMMNGFLHFSYLCGELVFLPLCDVIVVISTVGKGNLEINFGLLQLILV
jgi:hypothetical protein